MLRVHRLRLLTNQAVSRDAHFAIRAAAALRRRGRDIRLTVIGSGPMLSHLKKLVSQLALDQHVRFVAHMAQPDLFDCYGRAHVFVFPSLRDAGGNVVQEALSAGLPVVYFNLGGPPSFVDARCGVIVEARDAVDEQQLVLRLTEGIERATQSSERWDTLHRGALVRASEMTWGSQIERIQVRIRALFI